ncbi:MAG: hypothetical protein ACKO2G_09090 [Verrucomicrobiales bacterium]
MKIALIIAGTVFAIFAALQFNDSNSGIWIAMFFGTALLSWLKAGKLSPFWLLAVSTLACLGLAGWTASIEFKNPGCRIGTDIPGPVLCALWLGWLTWSSRGMGQQPRELIGQG